MTAMMTASKMTGKESPNRNRCWARSVISPRCSSAHRGGRIAPTRQQAVSICPEFAILPADDAEQINPFPVFIDRSGCAAR